MMNDSPAPQEIFLLKLGEVVLLGLCAVLGAAVYFLLAGLMRLEEMELARGIWNKLRKRG